METAMVGNVTGMPTGKKAVSGNNGRFMGNLNALSLLDKFVVQENVGKEKAVQVNAGASRLEKKFAVLLRTMKKKGWENYSGGQYGREMYTAALNEMETEKPSGAQIGQFVAKFPGILSKLEGKGLTKWKLVEAFCSFLSAAVNSSPAEKLVIPVEHLPQPLLGLGYKNSKDVVFIGDVGDYFCDRMEGGSVVVEGNVGLYGANELIGGRLTIHGNVGGCFAAKLKGGQIEIAGSVESFGPIRSGGTILLNGRYVVKNGNHTGDGKRMKSKDGTHFA